MISIVVPVYNAEAYLQECINSVLRQTYTDWELILVDDGSTDRSSFICEKYAVKDQRISVYHQENQGVSSARNLGIERAKGEFIFFCDSDDWMDDHALEILRNMQKANDADIVFADIISAEKNNRIYTQVFGQAFDLPASEIAEKIQKACIGYSYKPYPTARPSINGLGSVGNKLFRTSLIITNGIRFDDYTHGIYEDNLFTIACLDYAQRVAYISMPVYYYRTVGSSSVHRFRPESPEISRRIFERVEDVISRKKDKDSFLEAYYVLVIRRLSEEQRVYYFHPEHSMSTTAEIKELRKTIHQAPYADAIRKVRISGLMPAHKLTCLASKTKSATVMWIAFRIRDALNRKLQRKIWRS